MRLHRFIVEQKICTPQLRVSDKKILHQIKDVLRLKAGAKLIVADGAGNEADAVIREQSRSQLVLSVGNIRTRTNVTRREITLYASVLRRENFEFLAQKCTEAGVARIVPIIAERTVKTGLRVERIQKIIKEAAEQSGRADVPKIENTIMFSDVIQLVNARETALLFDLRGPSIFLAVDNFKNKNKASIFVGPEGGWTDRERSLAQKNGFLTAQLGELTLRAETAAIVGTFILANL